MKCQIRISEKVYEKLAAVLFRRYPEKEWGTFLDCGWVETHDGELILTVKDIRAPGHGDLDESIRYFGVNEQYISRTALLSEKSSFAVGIVHSHPEDYYCFPSELDDDMDGYLSKYFSSFAPGRPYVSLIFSKDKNGNLRFSGRCWWKNNWLTAEKVSIVGRGLQRVWSDNVKMSPTPMLVEKRLKRLVDGLGKDAARLLWNSTVVVIGAGGTGSPLIHSLARSCVKRIIMIDHDDLEYANSERIHGVRESDLQSVVRIRKVEIARRLVESICSDIQVVPYDGNALDPKIVKAVLSADLIFGCTDTEHGKVLLSDLSTRFLIPAFQVNVGMENKSGVMTGEIIHFTQYGPGLPCCYCRDQIDSQRLTQELMSDEERETRKVLEKKNPAGAYWKSEPVVPTIGSLTTIAGELSANYAIGLLSGRYLPPSTFIEINLLAPNLGVVESGYKPRKTCLCQNREGCASQLEPLISIF